MSWNISAAIKYLTSHAASSSQHQCAKYVRLAIEAGGISTAGRPVSAYQYKEFLPKIGFKAIGSIFGKIAQLNWTKSNAQPGDIAVMEHGVHGHICMYNGRQWISDFKQNNMWVYGGDGKCDIFRYNGEIDPSLSNYLDFTSTGLKYTVPLESQKDHIAILSLANTRYNIMNSIFGFLGDFDINMKTNIEYENYISNDDSSLSESLVSSGMFWNNSGSFGDFTFTGSEGSIIDVCKACYQAFLNIGCTSASAKGILANIYEESTFNPRIVTWDGSVKSGKFGVGGGLCGFYFNGALPELARHVGWTQEKLDKYNEMIKNSGLPKPNVPCHPDNSKYITSKFGGFPFSLEEQLSYLCDIINRKYSSIKQMKSESDAAMYWIKYYEKPAHIINRWIKHGLKINNLLSSSF